MPELPINLPPLIRPISLGAAYIPSVPDSCSEPPDTSHGVTDDSINLNPTSAAQESNDKDFSQAHLLHMGHSDGVSISPKPRQGKRVKSEQVLTMDWFPQQGKRVVSADGPMMDWLCIKHREYYTGRKA